MNISVFSAFCGYGPQNIALDRISEMCPSFSYTVAGWYEPDKYSSYAYDILYPGSSVMDFYGKNLNDIPDFDLFVYRFQYSDVIELINKYDTLDIYGINDSENIPSVCYKIISNKLPKYLVFEGPKLLVGKKYESYFELWKSAMVKLGYTNYIQVLNSKDYGIPQNRERLYMISIRDDVKIEESDDYLGYEFPEPIELNVELGDIMENDVDEKYYIDSDKVYKFMSKDENKELVDSFVK